MPVLNEAKTLHNTLNRLRISDNEELIVVDGGSKDGTVAIAREFTEKVAVAFTGRAHVMNTGAKMADGDILLFLHADCILPDGAFNIIRKTLEDKSVAAGAFNMKIDHPKLCFRIIERAVNLRAGVTSIPYGDQGIFLRTKDFEHIGGYAEIPLMEDIEISMKLKKSGKIVFVCPPVRVSPRRWLEEGIIHTTLRNWANAFSYTFLGVSPENLKKYYRDIR